VSDEAKVTGWWSFLGAVLLQPTWELMTTGAVFTLSSVGTWWRDNFASEEWKKRLELSGILPRWHPAWWVCIGLVVLILVLVRASHRLWKIEHEQLVKLKTEPIPELVISLVNNNRGDTQGIELKNVSQTDNLHNVLVAQFKCAVGEVSWSPGSIPYLQAGGGFKVIEPYSTFEWQGEERYAFNLKTLGKAIINKRETEGVEEMQFLAIADDARGNRYEFTAVIRFFAKGEEGGWLIGPLKRGRLRPITDKERLHKPRTWAWLEGKSSQPDNDSPGGQ
jgi:hypothetical protein